MKNLHQKSKNIFLNGTSSIGKTSIAKALQEQLPEPYLHIGIDTFLFMLAPKYMMTNSEAHLGIQFLESEDDTGKPFIEIVNGIYGDKLCAGMCFAIRSLIDEENHLIIDEVLYSQERAERYKSILQDQDALFVKVNAPLEVAEKRGKSRGDRVIGLARGLYNTVHSKLINYHFEVDTAQLTPEESASQIIHSYEKVFPQTVSI